MMMMVMMMNDNDLDEGASSSGMGRPDSCRGWSSSWPGSKVLSSRRTVPVHHLPTTIQLHSQMYRLLFSISFYLQQQLLL